MQKCMAAFLYTERVWAQGRGRQASLAQVQDLRGHEVTPAQEHAAPPPGAWHVSPEAGQALMKACAIAVRSGFARYCES